MQVNPYLFYNGNCEAAFKYYEKVLGARIEVMLTHEGAPVEMPTPAEWRKKIMHGRISIDGEVLMASDAPPGHFHQPQGFAVSLTVGDPADAERKFKALSEGGNVNMPFGQDLLLQGLWHVRGSVRDSLDGELPARGVIIGTSDRSPRARARAAATGASSIRRGEGSSRAPLPDRPAARPRTPPARHTSAPGGRPSGRHGTRGWRGGSHRCGCSAPRRAPACRPTGMARRSPRARPT